MSESELSRLEYERESEEDNLDPITGEIKPIIIDLDYVNLGLLYHILLQINTDIYWVEVLHSLIDIYLFYFSYVRASSFNRKTEIEKLLNDGPQGI